MAETVLVATLGGQPQVVTFALDALLARGVPIRRVYLLHLDARSVRLQAACQKVIAEFADHQYGGQPCQVQRVAVSAGGAALPAIQNEAEAEAAWQTVRALLAQLKNEGHTLHLCIAGGRRMLALLVTSAAMLLCDHHDRLWHLYTPDALQAAARDGARMHAQPGEGVQIIQVPLAPWGAYFPALRAMAQAPSQAIAAQLGWLTSGDDGHCRQVQDRLTERQWATLVAFADGLTPQDVAEALNITLSTVNTHKTVILAECRNAWALGAESRLDYHFLREHFGPYVRQLGV